MFRERVAEVREPEHLVAEERRRHSSAPGSQRRGPARRSAGHRVSRHAPIPSAMSSRTSSAIAVTAPSAVKRSAPLRATSSVSFTATVMTSAWSAVSMPMSDQCTSGK